MKHKAKELIRLRAEATQGLVELMEGDAYELSDIAFQDYSHKHAADIAQAYLDLKEVYQDLFNNMKGTP